MSIVVPFLSDDALRCAAADFLAEYHCSSSIPVPIDSIVEFDLGIDIVPIPGMHRSYDIDSMLSRDLQQICVDATVLENFPGRYRFSLAHEIGHRQLHSLFYNQLKFTDIAGWKDAVCNELGERDYGKLEFQAYAFAGLVLVPPKPLAEHLEKAISLAESKGVTISDDSDAICQAIEGYLSKEFVYRET